MKSSLLDKCLDWLRQSKYPEESVENIKETAKEVADKIDNDLKKYDSGVGLLVGEVQSGKTSNFIALSMELCDRDSFDLILILGGVIGDLRDQTVDRFKDFRSKTNATEINYINFTTKGINKINKYKTQMFENDKKTVMFCLKEKNNLTELSEFLSDLNCRILIIDDESDQATPNNEKASDKFLDVDNKELTRINSLITELINSQQQTFLLSVTATPFANLILSADYNISPEWGYVLTRPSEYCGLDEFHKVFSDYRDNKIRVLESFNESDGSVGRLNSNLDAASPEEGKWFNNELRKAIDSYVVGNEVLREIEPLQEEKYFEMIVHTHSKKSDHQKVEKMINKYLDEFSDGIFMNLNKKALSLEFDKYILQLPENKRSDAIEKKDIILENAFEKLFNHNSNLLIEINNGDSGNYDDDEISNLDECKDKIIIGADKIQRGITFKNLRSVFMPRIAVNPTADTILQRARWFGYRSEMFPYMTLFIPERLKNLYTVYGEIRNNIDNTLRNHYKEEISLNEVDIIIKVPKLDGEFENAGTLTRKSINRSEGNRRMAGSKTQAYHAHNIEYESEYLDAIYANENYEKIKFDKFGFVSVIVPIEELNDELMKIILNKVRYVDELEVFKEHCRIENIQQIAFTYMSTDSNKYLDLRERGIESKMVKDDIEGVKLVNIYSGRDDIKNDDDKQAYCGDRKILEELLRPKWNVEERGDLAEIQVHNVLPRIKRIKRYYDEIYMYSVKFPKLSENKYLRIKSREKDRVSNTSQN